MQEKKEMRIVASKKASVCKETGKQIAMGEVCLFNPSEKCVYSKKSETFKNFTKNNEAIIHDKKGNVVKVWKTPSEEMGIGTISVQHLLFYMKENFPYLTVNLSHDEIYNWLASGDYNGILIEAVADRFSDYLLSQGLCNVEE